MVKCLIITFNPVLRVLVCFGSPAVVSGSPLDPFASAWHTSTILQPVTAKRNRSRLCCMLSLWSMANLLVAPPAYKNMFFFPTP